jgi:hypothetical protein
MSNRTLMVAVVVVALLALGWLWTGGRMPQAPTVEPPTTAAGLGRRA